jgi:hypothetical protein
MFLTKVYQQGDLRGGLFWRWRMPLTVFFSMIACKIKVVKDGSMVITDISATSDVDIASRHQGASGLGNMDLVLLVL